MPIITSGVPPLDDLFVKGLPRGFCLLVGGAPGVGTELFAKQFASAGIGYENVIYFSTQERGEAVLATMHEFGWKGDMKIVDICTEYYENVLAKELEISKYRLEGIVADDVRKITAREFKKRTVNFLTKVTYEISKMKPPYRLIINSLDFFIELYELSDVLSTLRAITAYTQHQNSVALVTMLTNVYDIRIQSSIEDIVDCVIELERQRVELEYKNYLLLKKVRNHPEKTGIVPFVITDRGLQRKEEEKSRRIV